MSTSKEDMQAYFRRVRCNLATLRVQCKRKEGKFLMMDLPVVPL
uniref:Uncharacterized protein n=1 Tax=Arundo donax TaxID=35708 RepID=A0A0A9AC69_ARUDO